MSVTTALGGRQQDPQGVYVLPCTIHVDDKNNVCEETDPHVRMLVGIAGAHIPMSDAVKYGLVGVDGKPSVAQAQALAKRIVDDAKKRERAAQLRERQIEDDFHQPGARKERK